MLEVLPPIRSWTGTGSRRGSLDHTAERLRKPHSSAVAHVSELPPPSKVKVAVPSPERSRLFDRVGRWPEDQPRLVLIVRPASQLDVCDRRGPAVGVRDEVMKFEEGRFGAA